MVPEEIKSFPSNSKPKPIRTINIHGSDQFDRLKQGRAEIFKQFRRTVALFDLPWSGCPVTENTLFSDSLGYE